jgi:Cys-tRNA(Pro)/Cys-tRNA(Cys) deacylase
MSNKTQAMRILEREGISYSVHNYSAAETDAVQVALAVGASPDVVYKTLVVRRASGKPLLVMIPANSVLDLKKLAKILKEKKVKMASLKEAEKMTRMKKGGISAIALLNRGFEMMIDDGVNALENVYVSAGKRGIQIQLKTKDLLTVTEASVVDVVC